MRINQKIRRLYFKIYLSKNLKCKLRKAEKVQGSDTTMFKRNSAVCFQKASNKKRPALDRAGRC